jgi:hypothetical protein
VLLGFLNKKAEMSTGESRGAGASKFLKFECKQCLLVFCEDFINVSLKHLTSFALKQQFCESL